MKTDRYPLNSAQDLMRFEFVSEGPRGFIPKIIEFQRTEIPDVYNLAFGDVQHPHRTLNDRAVSNNGDTEKVLTTVAWAVALFLERRPYAFVYAEGSTPARNRLYRRSMARFLDELERSFYLYGRVGNEFFDFDPEQEYEGFLAQLKIP